MTHQQAWQHIIDMPIQMDVSAFLSAAYGADTVDGHNYKKVQQKGLACPGCF